MVLTLEIGLVLFLVSLAIFLFATELLPFDITALLIMGLLMLLNLVTPAQGISGFANSATITVLAMFILSGGIQRTGLLDLVARKVVRHAGPNPLKQVLLIALIVGPMSAFLNNTAVVAILMPVALTIARDTRTSPSKLLMPVSYASQLGGVMTLIGTSTNLLASGLSEEFGYGAFDLFMFSQVGFLVFLLGTVYLLTVGFRLIPARIDPEDARTSYRLEEYLAEVKVVAGSPLVGQRVAETVIQKVWGMDVLEVLRGGEVLRPPLDYVILDPEDILVISASRDELKRVSRLEGVDVVPELEEAALALTSEEVSLVEVLVPPNSRYIGQSLATLNFHERYGAQVVAISKTRAQSRRQPLLSRAPRRMHQRRLDPGDLLLVQVTPGTQERLERDPDLMVVGATPLPPYRKDKMPVALGILAGVVIVAAVGVYPILVTAVVGAVLMVITGCLRVGELYQSVQWNVIFLLGGLIPLGIAMLSTGAAELVGGILAGVAAYLPPLAILILLYAFTSLLTEVISNNASVLVMVPIAIATAVILGVNPITFILAVMFAGSTSMITPTGYQTNTMVWGPGGYRYTDFTRVGAPLNVMLAIVTPLLLSVFFPL